MVERFDEKIRDTVKLFSVIALILVIVSLAYGRKPSWYTKFKQIKPLISTKQDIERIFKNPKIIFTYDEGWIKTIEYKLKEGRLSISYSTGKCKPGSEYGYNVNQDVVTDSDFTLENQVKITRLGLDLRNFEKGEIRDIIGTFIYSNEDLGESYVGTSSEIKILKIFPTTAQESLACKKT